MSVLLLALLLVAFGLLVAAAFGVAHQRVQLVPLALALVLLAHLLRLWPP
ncbi:MAG TPA: hypothetical protein VN680_12750 [Burkholderiaceae bacterium]|nr:hypothetical protein [Burkholderiaceae bacterium]